MELKLINGSLNADRADDKWYCTIHRTFDISDKNPCYDCEITIAQKKIIFEGHKTHGCEECGSRVICLKKDIDNCDGNCKSFRQHLRTKNHQRMADMKVVKNGKYKVSVDGEIYRWKPNTGEWVECAINLAGQAKYKSVWFDGRADYVHLIVFKIYNNIDVIPKGMQIDHIDNNHHNNHYTNLRMITRSENVRKAIARSHDGNKLKQHLLRKKIRVKDINTNKVRTFKSLTSASKELEIPIQSIIDNLKGRSKVCYRKYRFKYV